jgi:sec-independent protein translocase protein TatA
MNNMEPSIFETMAFLTNIRGTQLFIIILAILLLFGAKRLPELARSLGKAIREFRKSASQIEEEFKTSLNEDNQVETKQGQVAKAGPKS